MSACSGSRVGRGYDRNPSSGRVSAETSGVPTRLVSEDLAHAPGSRRTHGPSGSSERFRPFVYEDLDDLSAPEVIAREIVDDLTAVLAEFEAVAAALEGAGPEG
jgi:hypothetical protein